jgi:hypothetical protein
MARAQAKKQRQTKTTQPSRARSGGRARHALGERVGAPPAASREASGAKKPGISNHPLSEDVERQRQLPPRGTQRKTTPTGAEVKRPVESAPIRRRGRAKDLEMPAEE